MFCSRDPIIVPGYGLTRRNELKIIERGGSVCKQQIEGGETMLLMSEQLRYYDSG